MRHDDAKAGEKRRGSGAVWQIRQCSPRVFFAYGEPGTERIRINADALKLAKQLLESLFLRHVSPR